MPCRVRQRNKAFTIAADELVDTCCVASGAFAALSATSSSANAAVMMDRRIVAIATMPRVQSLTSARVAGALSPAAESGQCPPLSGAGWNSQSLGRLGAPRRRSGS